MSRYLPMILLVLAGSALADGTAQQVASVEDNIRAMDTNHDGMVTATEVRVYLEAKNGKGYKQELLDEMEIMSGAKSCASPFSRSFF